MIFHSLPQFRLLFSGFTDQKFRFSFLYSLVIFFSPWESLTGEQTFNKRFLIKHLFHIRPFILLISTQKQENLRALDTGPFNIFWK